MWDGQVGKGFVVTPTFSDYYCSAGWYIDCHCSQFLDASGVFFVEIERFFRFNKFVNGVYLSF